MKLSEQHLYDAPPGAVWEMITDPAFRDDVCRATGASSWDVRMDVGDEGGTVSISRVLPAEVSDAVRKLVGETVTIVQHEVWGVAGPDGARSADVRLEVRGQPASMAGTHTLTPSGGGAALRMSGDLKVTIPFLGGRLEKELGKAVSAGLTKEHEVGLRYLA